MACRRTVADWERRQAELDQALERLGAARAELERLCTAAEILAADAARENARRDLRAKRAGQTSCPSSVGYKLHLQEQQTGPECAISKRAAPELSPSLWDMQLKSQFFAEIDERSFSFLSH